MHPSNQRYEPMNFLAAGDLVDALVAKVDDSRVFDVTEEVPVMRRCAVLARIEANLQIRSSIISHLALTVRLFSSISAIRIWRKQ